jgi:hypothetical protein
LINKERQVTQLNHSRILVLVTFVSIVILVSSVTHPTYAIKTINEDSGGDCSAIGTWSDVTRTCTLESDLSEDESKEYLITL